LFARFAGLFSSASTRFYRSEQQRRVIPWFRDKGDETLRLDYDLNEKSIVFDVGGYEGRWASEIFSRYACSVYVFEPVPQFAAKIANRFAKNSKVKVFDFGLADKTRATQIAVDRDASSVFRETESMEEIRLVRACDFINSNDISNIDLMKINIEGEEYDLLDHLLDSGLTERITNIQVQFHDFVPNAEERMNKIQKRLSKTHSLTYQYPFVWENWNLTANGRSGSGVR
jgi:FkbM family methyltransferase